MKRGTAYPTRRCILAIVSALLTLLVLSLFLPVRVSRIWIDPVTASLKSQDSFLVIPISTAIETSAIERWIVEHEGSYAPRWNFLSETDRTITGQVFCRGCGKAPENYVLHTFDLNARFVQAASDAEIAEFVRIMRAGTKSQREGAVDDACNKAVDARSRLMPRGVPSRGVRDGGDAPSPRRRHGRTGGA